VHLLVDILFLCLKNITTPAIILKKEKIGHVDILCSFIKQTYILTSVALLYCIIPQHEMNPLHVFNFQKVPTQSMFNFVCSHKAVFQLTNWEQVLVQLNMVLSHWIREFFSPYKKCKHPVSCCHIIEITQKYYESFEVWGCHSGVEEDSVVLDYNAMSLGEWLLMFNGNLPSLSSPAHDQSVHCHIQKELNLYCEITAYSC
jgi:hypothetical protein